MEHKESNIIKLPYYSNGPVGNYYQKISYIIVWHKILSNLIVLGYTLIMSITTLSQTAPSLSPSHSVQPGCPAHPRYTGIHQPQCTRRLLGYPTICQPMHDWADDTIVIVTPR
jgi:hypothetical protein